ncbi:hypothetical protein IP81_08810 [Novosphingobium sp. AAP83]|uniref:pesticin C-terminus-like muramidase n=1 Tax=Novosphingobium sp. AAP83 TaxID=1523425 RepID=UPI0006B9B290|nr:pesticin C-terminus-like muramidase [Novosphingobium sp. AAP83]KPF92118.1 hypothetical protein IP81_08810 [Novosphingobium sp. AAP83]
MSTADPRAIKIAQHSLQRLGHATGTADGRIGPQTTEALRQFQQANGLVPDGKLGPKTLALLAAKDSIPANALGQGLKGLMAQAKDAILAVMNSSATARKPVQKCPLAKGKAAAPSKKRKRITYCVPANGRTKGNFVGEKAKKVNEDYGTSVDFDKLSQWEGGQHIDAYVAWWPGAKDNISGVTLGTGVDVGQTNDPDKYAKEMAKGGVPQETVDKLKPYMGLKQQAACDYLSAHPLTLSKDEADAIDNWAKRKHLSMAKSSYDTAMGPNPDPAFKDLTPAQQTLLLSRTYQQGPGMPTKKISKGFYDAALDGDWDKAADQLDAMADKAGFAKGRTDKEAAYLRESMNEGQR